MARKSPTPERQSKPHVSERSDKSSAAVAQRTLGKYHLSKKLGSGGMGTVYLAVDADLNRTVALKVLPKEKAENPLLVKRFRAEAQAAAQLKHQNIVMVYEAGEIDGLLFIALEYVDGVDVQNLLDRRGAIAPKKTLEIIKQVARALDHAHQQKVVHRDIKPSNLMIDRHGVVKLTDLGLARLVDEAMVTSITRAGTTVGTVDYMAPEQARDSKAADIRSDIYSLGCTWYHMLTGTPPFAEGSMTNKLSAHAMQPPPDPRAVNSAIPEGVVVTLQRMMAKSPQDRYQSPRALLRDLENSRITREAISDDALAALAVEGAEDSTARPSGTRRSTAAVSAAAVSAGDETAATSDGRTAAMRQLPPTSNGRPSERKFTQESESEPESVHLSPSQNLFVAAGAVVLLLVIWWISSRQVEIDDTPEYAPPAYSPPPPPKIGSGRPPGPPTVRPGRNQPPVMPGSNPRPVSDPPENPTVGPSPVPRHNPNPPVASVDPPPNLPPLGRKGEDVPPWTQALRGIAAGDASPGMSEISVAAAQNAAVSLDNLLRDLPAAGGILRLAGNGIYVVNSQELTGKQRIVITADGDRHPLLVFQGRPSDTATEILRVHNGSLAVDGVDLAATAERMAGKNQRGLISVTNGNLIVRNCSVTVQGPRSQPATAFRIRAQGQSCRVLLENSFIRGNHLTPVDVVGRSVEMLAVNCLLAGGDGPAVNVGDSSAGGNAAAGAAARTVRLLSCTACGRKSAFQLSAAGGAPNTSLTLQNSVVGAEAGATSAILLSIADWPQAGGRKPAGLACKIDSCFILGWAALGRGQANGIGILREPEAWAEMWQSNLQRAQFQYGGWPEDPIENYANVSTLELDAGDLVLTGVSASDGGQPGCDISKMSAPHSGDVNRALNFTLRAPVQPESQP